MYKECQGPFNFSSNTVKTKILDIQIKKIPSCDKTVVGGRICYTITIENNNNVDLVEYLFSDMLAKNLTYVEGSFTVDGEFIKPIMIGNEINHTLNIDANQTVVISFCVIVTSK